MEINKNKTALKYTKERVLFSDILPYEMPLIFSNRYFYNFLVKNGIQIKEGNLEWKNDISDEDFEILKFMLYLGNCAAISKTHCSVNVEAKLITIPFVYKIAHKENAFRELAVIHPINQLNVVEFYDAQRTLILHYCSRSNFSVRYPAKMASYYFYKDRLHRKLLGHKADSKEEFMKEYENLKSYFSYKHYAQIYKFYEGERYQTAEKKYKKQYRFDIQSCFNSIYTHSISWATLDDKTLYKYYYVNDKMKSSDDFGAAFDRLMQRMNHNETNGILIGPEFSRIFAEVILQHIDRKVELQMAQYGYKNKVHYECYRYVDDYFVYFNDDDVKNKIYDCLSNLLRDYKMCFNQSKNELNERPFITGVSIAKEKIDELLKDKLRIDFSTSQLPIDDYDESVRPDAESEEGGAFKIQRLKGYLAEDISLFFRHTNFNMRYKIIINESNVEYRDIINYTLSRMLLRLERVLNRFDDRFRYLAYYIHNLDTIDDPEVKRACIEKHRKYENLMVKFLLGLLDSVFFIYANNKRINTTLKVVAILNVIILYLKNNYHIKNDGNFIRFQYSSIETIFRKIQSEVILSLETSCSNINTQLEPLYLLLPMKELGDDYNIPLEVIDHCISFDADQNLHQKTNTLAILLLIYYMGGQDEYIKRFKSVEACIVSKINSVYKEDRRRNTEIIILVMDSLTCPFFSSEFKKSLLSLLGVSDDSVKNKIIDASLKQKVWFTKWKDFNLNSELSAKVSQEVYS